MDHVVETLEEFPTEFPVTAGRYGVRLDAQHSPDPNDYGWAQRRGDYGSGKDGITGSPLEPATTTAAVSSPTSTTVTPAATTAVEPAAVIPVVAALIPAAGVAAPAKEAIVTGTGARARAGPSSSATSCAAAPANKVDHEAKDHADRYHDCQDQEQFHGTILSLDVTRMRG